MTEGTAYGTRAWLFAGATLAIGMASAGLGYGLFGPPADGGLIDPPIWPPRWFFWFVWVLLYPPTGVAASLLQAARRDGRSARVAWRLFVISFCTGLAWVPVVQANHSAPEVQVAMDLLGGATGLVAWRAAWSASRRAFAWLVPVNVWGLVTTLLKIWRLMLNA